MLILYTYDKRLYTENVSRLTDWNDDEKKTWLHLENTFNNYLRNPTVPINVQIKIVYIWNYVFAFSGPEVTVVKPGLSKGGNYAVD
jgi:hypothetical protein